MSYFIRLLGVLVAIGFASTSSATILNFDSIAECLEPIAEPVPDTYYEESGYQVTTTDVGSGCYGGFNDVHLDYDGDGTWHKSVAFDRVDGGLFDALSFDITSTFNYFTDFRFVGFIVSPGDIFKISGYRDGVLIASQNDTFHTGERTVTLTGFLGIDELRFDPLEECECELNYENMNGSHHFSIDNLNVVAHGPAPVPVPPALAGLALGLGLLGGLKRRRRR